MSTPRPAVVDLNADTLRAWPLPQPGDDGDKNTRGRVLIVGGCIEVPGAVVLSANAALRAGCGKVGIATLASLTTATGLAVPEARVMPLPQTAEGCIAAEAAQALDEFAERYDVLLLGPGMFGSATVDALVRHLLQRFRQAAVILDAAAMNVLCAQDPSPRRFDGPVLLTPHGGEMAHISGLSKDDIQQRPEQIAAEYANRWNAVIALKGNVTHVAAPNQPQLWRNSAGSIGLATSGSGDTLSGIIAGLAARGASLQQAAAWGVHLHALAGERLSRQRGPLGYLAREIPDMVPRLMHELT